MLPGEAVRLREILLEQAAISPLLNLGSSTRAFREEVQPHIARDLFAPLHAAGIETVHCDLKQGEGVDVVGDILDPDVRARLRQGRFKALLLANLLEHVRDRAAVAAACEDIVGPGGLLLVSAPLSYPYHADPIDTRYRPSPEALAALFRGSHPLLLEELSGGTYREEMRAHGVSPWGEAVRTGLAGLASVVRPRSFFGRADRWRWYNSPYRVSIALLKVVAS